MSGARPPGPLPAAPEKARILVVEDEEHLAEGIALNLDAEGFTPILARTGPAALEAWRRGARFDLVVLDVMLPGVSGFGVCEEIRRAGDPVPILFLTAKGRAEDRVRGLELGGDDYLAKPFHLQELLSRVRALLRGRAWARAEGRPAPAPSLPAGPVAVGAGRVDLSSGACTEASGEADRLTDKELAILRLLLERSGEAVSRAEIVERVWPGAEPPTARTIDNFLVRLRRRFERDPATPAHFLTVFGVGYRYGG